jgi:hypothetical protein
MRLVSPALIVAIGFALAGCSGGGGMPKIYFGDEPKAAPIDTNLMLLNPPLSVPPGFNAPPMSAPDRSLNSADQLQQASLGAADDASVAAPAAPQTPGEQAFLQAAAGPSGIDPNVRAQMDQAAAAAAGMDPVFMDKLIFGSNTPAGSGPVIQRHSSGVLDSVF